MPPVTPEDTAADCRKTRPKRGPSCFLGCFGFSMKLVGDEKSPEKPSSGRRKGPRRRLPLSGLWIRKSGFKTVPVDSPVDRKAGKNIEIPSATMFDRTVGTAETPPQEETVLMVNREDSVKFGSERHDTSEKRPEPKPKLRRTAAVSIPARTENKKPANQTRPHESDRNGASEKLDPYIGMSMMIVTLLIMLLWGRLCAIVCTCAWCYFIPRRLRGPAAAVHDSGGVTRRGPYQNSDSIFDPDLSSEVYKKRVVLEGFLRRSHRGTVGGGP